MSFGGQLTTGAIKAIYNSEACQNPILQIIDVRKIQGPQHQANSERFR